MTFGSFPAVPSVGGTFNPANQNPKQESMQTNVNQQDNVTQIIDGGNKQSINDSKSPVSNTGNILESFQNLLSNANRFPQATYSGIPGMLGLGSQSSKPQPHLGAPTANRQYMDPKLTNLTESALPYPSYSGLPGMQGIGTQTPGTINSPSIAVLPDMNGIQQSSYGQNLTASESAQPPALYNGYPGMLGTSSIYNGATAEVTQTFGQSRTNIDGDTKSTGQGHSNKETNNFRFSQVAASGGLPGSVPSSNNYGMGNMQQTKISTWNGDWPGK